MRRLLIVSLTTTLAACTSLQGIPPSLNDGQLKSLASREINQIFTVVDAMYTDYQEKRNDNLKYSFWSNAPFIPFAMAAALHTYHGGHQTALANIGVGAGGLAATNTFIGAGKNANVYQSAINSLSCLEELRSYTSVPLVDGSSVRSPKALKAPLKEVEEALANAQRSLHESIALNSASKEAQAELKANPGLAAVRTSNTAALQNAITAAQAAITSANQEIVKFGVLPDYIAGKVRRIAAYVSGNVKQQTVSYSDQVATLLSSLPKASSSADAKVAGAAPAAPLVALVKQKQPLTEDIKNTETQTQKLVAATTDLVLATSNFRLTAAQNSVEACLANN